MTQPCDLRPYGAHLVLVRRVTGPPSDVTLEIQSAEVKVAGVRSHWDVAELQREFVELALRAIREPSTRFRFHRVGGCCHSVRNRERRPRLNGPLVPGLDWLSVGDDEVAALQRRVGIVSHRIHGQNLASLLSNACTEDR